jgi:NADPH-dependent 2,4-dienoyl-CoA reductase/sulfur reductase-like enzyme
MSGSAPSRSPTGWRAALRAALLSSLAVRDSLPDFREHLATLIKVTASLSVVATSGVVLAARLWLSQAVFVHGLMVMMQAEGFSHEPSGWSALAQGVLPVLLTVGLLTRPVALLLLVGSGIGLHHELSGPQIVLLIWLLVQGAGLISLDCLMGRGLTRAPIWGVHAVNGMYRFLTRVSADVLPFATRAYVAVTVAAGSGAALWPQPISGDPLTAPWWVILLCWALIAGVLTRPVGLLFCLAAPLSSLAGAGHDEIGLMLLLLLLAGSGAGKLSLDRMLAEAAASGGVTPPEMADSLPHVVVVGGGFGGMAVVRALRSAPCRITLIDRRNHSLFQPLLYQVATAALSPADIALPIRTALRGQQNVGIRLAEVVGVDRDQRRVLLHEGVLPFDHLVLATGARHGYFGHDEWATLAPGLKSIEDATAIRGRLLRAFEEAENEADPDRQKAWLTFVIVGGGPTGVELAGALAELARTGMEREYRRIDPTTARVILAQSGARLLPAFSPDSSLRAQRSLLALGVEVLVGARVTGIDAQGVDINDMRIPARTTMWAAGGCRLTRGRVAGTGKRPLRPCGRHRRSICARLRKHLCDRRHRRLERLGRKSGARPCTRRQTTGQIRRARHPVGARPPGGTSSVPVSALWQPCYDRASFRGRRASGHSPLGVRRMVGLGSCPCALLGRMAKPNGCDAQLALGLCYVPARHAIDHEFCTGGALSRSATHSELAD